MEKIRLLIINPGSTSTKIGVYDDENMIFEETIRHSSEEIGRYKKIYDQYEFRKDLIVGVLEKNGIAIDSLHGIVGRGGLLKPIEGGTYKVSENMLEDLKIGFQGQHASNLGGIIANEIGQEIGKPSYIVDPVVVDELDNISRVSGLKEIERRSIFHALNQKAVARRYAKEVGKNYDELNLIVVHLGGGISVGAHRLGKVIDAANALDGEGPFSPERAGGLPAGSLVEMCYSGNYTIDEMKKKLTGKGGIVSYLDTNNTIEISQRVKDGDEYASLIYRAMAYQVSKEIGACAVSLKGKIDQIIITGGIAYDDSFVAWIKESVSFLGDITVYPGEDELMALAQGGLRVLRGEEEAKEYK